MVDLSIVMIVYQRVRSITVWWFSYLSGWWFQPLWKIWTSVGMIILIIPNIWKKMFHSTNQIYNSLMVFLLIWLVVSTPLKNMKVSWDDYSQYMEENVPDHQPYNSLIVFLLMIPYSLGRISINKTPGTSCRAASSSPKSWELKALCAKVCITWPSWRWLEAEAKYPRSRPCRCWWQESFEQTLKLPFKHCLSVPVFKSCLHDINSGQNRLKTNLKHRKTAGRNMESLDLARSHNSVCQRELVSRFTLPGEKMRFLQLYPYPLENLTKSKAWIMRTNPKQLSKHEFYLIQKEGIEFWRHF